MSRESSYLSTRIQLYRTRRKQTLRILASINDRLYYDDATRIVCILKFLLSYERLLLILKDMFVLKNSNLETETDDHVKIDSSHSK
jgi:hypothetical protein